MNDVKINTKEEALKEEFRTLSEFKLKQEYHNVKKNYKKENMLDALLRMSALISVMEERGVKVPKESYRNQARTGHYSRSNGIQSGGSGVNGAAIAIGFVIMMAGIGLTAASGGQAVFYGAILVGFFKMITGFIA